MTNYDQLPPGASPRVIHCCACSAPIHTHSFTDPANRLAVELENKFAKWIRCETCMRAKVAASAEEQKLERLAAWQALCPPELRGLVRHKLPSPHKLDLVLRWQFGPRGLLLHGKTRQGKSFCAWHLLKREMLAGKTAAVVNEAFADIYWAKMDSKGTFAWLEECAAADILLADDVFKTQLMTPGMAQTGTAVESALYNLLVFRMNHRKPTIMTSNDVGDTLKTRLSFDRGEPLVRRLRENFEALGF